MVVGLFTADKTRKVVVKCEEMLVRVNEGSVDRIEAEECIKELEEYISGINQKFSYLSLLVTFQRIVYFALPIMVAFACGIIGSNNCVEQDKRILCK